jgi:hydroxymethylbilane synthase
MTAFSPSRPLRIGTRGSPLALAQAEQTRSLLAAAHPELAAAGAIETVIIKTTGDRIQDRTLIEAGGKGLFTKEIEEALSAGGVDLAVHSMKDVPTWLPQGLDIVCILRRADPRDAWFSASGAGLDELPAGAVVGTASLRRQAQILRRRPDLKIVPLRGNVGTRLEKLARGEVAATLLALAGLTRLRLNDRLTEVLEPEVMLPAVAQGAIGIEIRTDDDAVRALLAPLHCTVSAQRVAAERALLAVLDGSCRTPIAALAHIDATRTLTLRGLVLRPDGMSWFETEREGPAQSAAEVGQAAGEELRRRLPAGFFAC